MNRKEENARDFGDELSNGFRSCIINKRKIRFFQEGRHELQFE